MEASVARAARIQSTAIRTKPASVRVADFGADVTQASLLVRRFGRRNGAGRIRLRLKLRRAWRCDPNASHGRHRQHPVGDCVPDRYPHRLGQLLPTFPTRKPKTVWSCIGEGNMEGRANEGDGIAE